MNIGAKIKYARTRKGLTQEQLAKMIGSNRSAIAKYETGEVQNIKRSKLQALAVALDLNPAELVFEEPIDIKLFVNEDIEEYIDKTIEKKIADIKVDYKISTENPDFIIKYEKLSNDSKKEVERLIEYLTKIENA